MADNNEIPSGHAVLESCGIREIRQADRTLELIISLLGSEGFMTIRDELFSCLGRTADPDMALNNLERFLSELDPPGDLVASARSSPQLLPLLMTLFGASRFLSLYAASTAAETLRLMADPLSLASAANRGMLEDRLTAGLKEAVKEDGLFRALRTFRKREMLRIAVRDLSGKAELADTVRELSTLAEVCLQAACAWYEDDLQKRHGRPSVILEDGGHRPAGFAVIAMGKLGGQELNFSSDVDLMYVYTADGETEGIAGPDGERQNRIANHQYFVKLAEKVSAAIGRTTEDGFVFRVDLRLRPEGQKGPIAQSLGGYEIYYESWGQTWERSALVKARPVAGDEAVGREFLARVAPFVYRKYLDFSALVEIREMKQRINREVHQKGRTHRDVKLGYGGIREIEFVVQALQLIYGGRDRSLRERGTMRALHLLAQKGLLSWQETADLSRAYVFLRTVEHRLQMENDLQTQTMPEVADELRILARRTGYLTSGREAELMLRDYQEHTERVRAIYDSLLSQPEEAAAQDRGPSDEAALLDPGTGEREAVELLTRSGFRDAPKAYRNIVLLREGQAFVHQTPRSRKVFAELFPVLFREIVRSPDPDLALNHFESYLASQGSWDAFRAVVRHDARAVPALMPVLGSSEYFSRMLIRDPSLLQDLLDAGEGTHALMPASGLRRELSSSLDSATSVADKLDSLRRFKHREELRIGMADLAGELPFPAVCRGLSRLAEACLAAALGLAVREVERKLGGAAAAGLAIVGAGKLGGRELIYGSDLDILFVFDEARSVPPPAGLTPFEVHSKVAEKTLSYLTTLTREGAAYRVDTRLRPGGQKGTLVQSIEAYRSYFTGPAETWERQALLHLRFIAGDPDTAQALISQLRGLVYRKEEPRRLAVDIRAMRKRMEEELAKEDDRRYNVKQGPGGLVDIEFLAQYLQLLHGRDRSRIRVPGTLAALRAVRRERLLSAPDHQVLHGAYLFLRRLESRMRIVANQATSYLERDPARAQVLGRRMGFPDGAALIAEYESVRRTVRAAFDRLLVP